MKVSPISVYRNNPQTLQTFTRSNEATMGRRAFLKRTAIFVAGAGVIPNTTFNALAQQDNTVAKATSNLLADNINSETKILHNVFKDKLGREIFVDLELNSKGAFENINFVKNVDDDWGGVKQFDGKITNYYYDFNLPKMDRIYYGAEHWIRYDSAPEAFEYVGKALTNKLKLEDGSLIRNASKIVVKALKDLK